MAPDKVCEILHMVTLFKLFHSQERSSLKGKVFMNKYRVAGHLKEVTWESDFSRGQSAFHMSCSCLGLHSN